MKIKTALTISRDSNDKIRIRVKDRASSAEFLEVYIDAAEFALALTGLSYVECTGEVRGLEYVGRQLISEHRTVEYTHGGGPKRHELEAWLLLNCQEEGWMIDPYLGSQGSVSRRDGKTFLNYRVKRYEAMVEENE